jgi:hypothetical protein
MMAETVTRVTAEEERRKEKAEDGAVGSITGLRGTVEAYQQRRC